MPVITAIEIQKKNPNRVNIYIDDQFAFGLARILAVWLKTGQEINAEKITSLREEDAREMATQKALHFLSYRPRSIEEVRKNLVKHEIPENVIEDTLEKLQRNGLLGDEAFAKTWVENRNEFRPRGKRALKMELRQKGIDETLIQNVLDQDVDEDALALQAARKAARKWKSLEWPEFRNKLGSFLARKGFSYEVLSPVVREVWEELHNDSADITLSDEELI